MIKILKHGNKFGEPLKATCICGCEFQYESSDILNDTTLMFATYPGQVKTYILCPECRARINLSTRYVTDGNI